MAGSRLGPWRPSGEDAPPIAGPEQVMGYLPARTAWIPNYRQRRRERRSIGSGQVEQANDPIVARRQQRRGMGGSLASSAALAALRTLLVNGGRDQ